MKAEVAMKDLSVALLGALFVIISLVSLITADPAPAPGWLRGNAQEQVAEIELRYALRR